MSRRKIATACAPVDCAFRGTAGPLRGSAAGTVLSQCCGCASEPPAAAPIARAPVPRWSGTEGTCPWVPARPGRFHNGPGLSEFAGWHDVARGMANLKEMIRFKGAAEAVEGAAGGSAPNGRSRPSTTRRMPEKKPLDIAGQESCRGHRQATLHMRPGGLLFRQAREDGGGDCGGLIGSDLSSRRLGRSGGVDVHGVNVVGTTAFIT